MYKKILVPLDGSKLSEEALPYAQEIARRKGAEVVLLRVLVYPVYDYLMTDPTIANMIADDMEHIKCETQKYVERIANQLRGEGLKACGEVHGGPVAEAILSRAQQLHADLIVMATHGRDGAQRWLLGSIADKVVHSSCAPVLLVRAQPHIDLKPLDEDEAIELNWD
jgi:nucleotide-binding universal stress UspA family protein